MAKIKTNEPPKLPLKRLPLWTIEVRRKFTKLTCPRCKESFYVSSTRWANKRRKGWSCSAPCPFCFRAGRDPVPNYEEEKPVVEEQPKTKRQVKPRRTQSNSKPRTKAIKKVI